MSLHIPCSLDQSLLLLIEEPLSDTFSDAIDLP
jgi:hypothetical protein